MSSRPTDSSALPKPLSHRDRTGRRRLLVVTAAVVAVLALAIGAYAAQRASRFVREEGGTLVVYAGLPSFNLPGLPDRVLSLDQRPDGLRLAPSADPRPVVAAVGPRGDLAAALRAVTKPAFAAMEQYGGGDAPAARAASIRIVDDPRAPAEEHTLAWLILAETATVAETSRFPPLLQSPRRELREAGARALARVAPAVALAHLDAMRPDDRADVLPAAIRELAAPCTDGHLSLLDAAFTSTSATPQNADIVDAALRAGCRPPVASLLRGVQRERETRVTAVAALAGHRGDAAALAAAIDTALGEPGLSEWRRGTYLSTLVAVGRGACSPALRQGLSSTEPAIRLTAMAAVGRFCAGSRFDASWNPVTRAFEAALTVPGTDTMRLGGIRGRAADDALVLRRLIALLPPGPAAVEGLRAAFADAGPGHLGEALIDALAERGDTTRLPQSMVTANRLELRRAAIDHWRAIDERAVVRDLIPRLAGGDESFATLLGRIPLQAGELTQIRALLSGPPAQQRQAACVVAMQGEPRDVAALLTTAEGDVRGRAADCLPFNRDAEAILRQVPDTVEGFPLTWRSTAGQRLARKRRLIEELQRMPAEVRQWTVEGLDTGEGGWFAQGPGLRAWLEEQAFLGRMRRRVDAAHMR